MKRNVDLSVLSLHAAVTFAHMDIITDEFLRGDWSSLTRRSPTEFEQAGQTDLLVASLVLSGDWERASALAHKSQKPKSESKIEANSGLIPFAMALGHARSGRYEEAEAEIESLSHKAPTKTSLRNFYQKQAIGFIQFFRGDSEATRDLAREALTAAEETEHSLQPFARLLSLDLLGHSLVRAGSVREGLRTLKSARELAGVIGNRNFHDAIAISILKYESLHGIEPHRIIGRLGRALNELKPKDSYSRSELRLELAHQLALRGKSRDAQRFLEAAAEDVLGTKNHQQSALLHFRKAWIAHIEGRSDAGLLDLRSAELGLKVQHDREMLERIAHLRIEILEGLSRQEEARKLRAQLTSKPPTAYPDTLKALLDLGYFGLLLPKIGVPLASTALVFGLPGGGLLVVSDGDVRLNEQGLKGVLGRILVLLRQRPHTRAEIIEIVWGYRYEAERHDRLLGVALSRIRKALGEKWIEIEGERVALRAGVAVHAWPSEKNTSVLPVLHSEALLERISDSLNIRQLQLLEELGRTGDLGVTDVVTRFGVSRASALRDLNLLVEKGYLKRVGHTRATRYIRHSRKDGK